MKEITRRNFLRMATIAVLISGMGMLSSCGKSKEELMSGDWYLQGDDRLSLSLYDDGTCQIRGDYGQGKWSIVDEDTLKLTDFYGETLELELPNGETVTYYHTAEEALKH